jgi:hypothetical protein
MRPSYSAKLLSAIVLVGALSLMTGMPLLQPASAMPSKNSFEILKKPNPGSGNTSSDRQSQLPQVLSLRIRRDLAQRTNIPARTLRITEAQRHTWRNTCLELPAPGELCGQSVVEGWRVVVTYDRQTWIYHTNRDGQILRLEAENRTTLPASVSEAVFQDISRKSNVPRRELQITRAEQRTWNNGCLGLAEPGVFCTQVVVPGWRVQVEGANRTWVYRTNQTGSVIKLEKQTNVSQLKPTRLKDDELPDAVDQETVFRALTSGGFAGQTTQTLLLKDGRLLRAQRLPNGTYSNVTVHRLSSPQLRQFQTVLEQAQLEQFDRLNYPASPGSADFFTVTLTSPSATVQYSDSIQEQLPDPLKTVIQAWQNLTQFI